MKQEREKKTKLYDLVEGGFVFRLAAGECDRMMSCGALTANN